MTTSPLQWNDPKRTWPLASYERTERRAGEDRRTDPKRSAEGDRRVAEKRSLRSLLKL